MGLIGKGNKLPKTGSKNFRTRKLEYNKPLAIINEEDLDEDDIMMMTESKSTISTGMEKEEEEERHLKDILITAPTSASANKIIPIPMPKQIDPGEYSILYPVAGKVRESKYYQPPERNDGFFHLGLYYRVLELSNESPDPRVILGNNSIGNESILAVCSGIDRSSFDHDEKLYIPYSANEEDMKELDKIVKNFNNEKPINLDMFEAILWILDCLHLFGFESILTQIYEDSLNGRIHLTKLLNLYLMAPITHGLTDLESMALKKIYRHWWNRKVTKDRLLLLNTIRLDDTKLIGATKTTVDQYACFRKRELMIQRKTRRFEAVHATRTQMLLDSLENLLALMKLAHQRNEIWLAQLDLERKICRFLIQTFDEMRGADSTRLRTFLKTLAKLLQIQKQTLVKKIPISKDQPGLPDIKCPLYQKATKADLFLASQSYGAILFVYSQSTYPNEKNQSGNNTPHTIFTSSAPWTKFFRPMEVTNNLSVQLLNRYRENGNRVYNLNRIFEEVNDRDLVFDGNNLGITSNLLSEYDDESYNHPPRKIPRYRPAPDDCVSLIQEEIHGPTVNLPDVSILSAYKQFGDMTRYHGTNKDN